MPQAATQSSSVPTLTEFIEQARPLNPDVSDEALASFYSEHYASAKPTDVSSLPTMDEFVAKAKPLNPDVSDTELKSFWKTAYGMHGAKEHEPTGSDVARGFSTAMKQIPQLGHGLIAGVGAAGEAMLPPGQAPAFTKLKEYGVEGYQKWGEKIEAQSKRSDDIIYSYNKAKEGDFGAFVDWLQYGIGYGGGQAVQMLVTAGVGAIAGKATLGEVIKVAAEKMIAREASTIAATEAGKKLAANEVTQLATAHVASRIGQTAAIGATAVGMEGGEIFGDLTARATAEGRELTGEELARAFGLSVGAGLLEFIGDKFGLDVMLGRKFKGVAGKVAKIGATTATTAAIEGSTEYAQTLLEAVGKGQDPLSDATTREAINSAALGAVAGGTIGGVGGVVQSVQPAIATTPAKPVLQPPVVAPPEKRDEITAVPDAVGVENPAVNLDEAIRTANAIVDAPIAKTVTPETLDEAIKAQIPETSQEAPGLTVPPRSIEVTQAPDFMLLAPQDVTASPVPEPATALRYGTTRPTIAGQQDKLAEMKLRARIHALADSKGIPWDNDPDFMALTEQVTGQKHLDKLRTPDLQKVFAAIEARPSEKPPQPSPTPEVETPPTVPTQPAPTAPVSEAAPLSPLLQEYLERHPESMYPFIRKKMEGYVPDAIADFGGKPTPVKVMSWVEKDIALVKTPMGETHLLRDAAAKLKALPGERTPTYQKEEGPEGSPEVVRPREDLSPEQSQNLLDRAEVAASLVAQGKAGKRIFQENINAPGQTVTGQASTYPKFYGPLKMRKEKVLEALEKIKRDKGEDVGPTVERVKAAILADRDLDELVGEFPETSDIVKTVREQQSLYGDEAFTPSEEPEKKLEAPEPFFTSKPEQKEPWQMSALEYSQSRVPESIKGKITKAQKTFEAQHRKEITAAIAAGKKVPAEVIADYPDLVPTEDEHEFSTVQINLPPEIAKEVNRISGMIADEDLAEEGREDQPHITVKYGLHTENAAKVKSVLAGEKPVKATIGKLDIFKATPERESDVLILKVTSPDLDALNEHIADSLPNTETTGDYKAHITVAYLKPGMGQKYVKSINLLLGKRIKIDRVVFSDKNENQVTIPLKGEKPVHPEAVKLATMKATNEERKTQASIKLATWVQGELAAVKSKKKPETVKEPSATYAVEPQERQRNLEAFMRGSKVVNEDGSPKVVYHGTQWPFTEFDKKQIRSWSAGGFWFAERPAYASAYGAYEGGSVMPVYLSITNPASWDEYMKASRQVPARGDGKQQTDAIQQILKNKGYDGVNLDQGGDQVWIAFEPSQIKSAIANRGTFSPAVQSLVAEAGTPYAPTFYSQLERTVSDRMPNRASMEQVRGIVKDSKPEELKWTGLDDYLKTKDYFTKVEVLDFVRQNTVQVQEIEKGTGKDSPEKTEEIKRLKAIVLKGGYSLEVNPEDPHIIAFMDVTEPEDFINAEEFPRSDSVTRNAAIALEKIYAGGVGDTKFASYTLPGGTDYRELLLTLPEHGTGPFPQSERFPEGRVTFTGGHWSEPNVLAHVRFNTRYASDDGTTYTPSRKILFIEEIQSDWHQKGKRQGYQGEPTTKLTTEQSDRLEELSDLDEKGLLETGEQHAEFLHLSELAKTSKLGLVPDAPFKKTWHELAMKRMLRYAAEHGYDKLAWTTGAQQAERYDLSKQIDTLRYEEIEKGKYDLFAEKDGRDIIERSNVPSEKLADYVGKDVAERILRNEGRAGTGEDSRAKYLTGLQLQVGGEGMKGFYDLIVPAFLNKYAKKWGATVGKTQIAQAEGGADYVVEHRKDGWAVFEKTTSGLAEYSGGHKTRALAEAEMSKLLNKIVVSVPSLDITPAMRESVLTHGQALFEKQKPYPVRQGEPAQEDRQLALFAIGDLDRAGSAVSSTTGAMDRVAPGPEDVKTVAVGISPDLIHKGIVDLKGYRVTSAEDLAKLAQVYRDPRFETFRIFYTKGDTIVGHEGVTSRLPGIVLVFVSKENTRMDSGEWAKEKQETMKALGADGYWLLHNHPSGVSLPSEEDRSITANIDMKLDGFKGHVVIDSNEYSVIDIAEHGQSVMVKERLPVKFGKEQLLRPSRQHPLLSRKLLEQGDLVRLAQDLKSPDGYVTVIYRAANGKVRAIQEMPVEFFMDTERSGAYFMEQAVAFGSTGIFTYYNAANSTMEGVGKFTDGIKDLLEKDILRDHIWDYAQAGRPASAVQRGVFAPLPEYSLGRNIKTLTGERVAEAIDAYEPKTSVSKQGDHWRYQTIEGTFHPATYPTKAEATEAAERHYENRRQTFVENRRRGPIFAEASAPYGRPDYLPAPKTRQGEMYVPTKPSYAMPAYSVTQPSFLDKVIRVIEDKSIDIRRLVDAIKATGKELADEINPVLAEEMYHGRAAKAVQDFLTDELDPLVKAMMLNKVSQGELNQYAHARHAKEANAYLKTINADLPQNDSLSGMSNAEADRILSQSDRPKMDRLMVKLDAIIARTRQKMIDYGLESKETINKISKVYDFYVPLQREGMEEEIAESQGLSVRGSTVKRRLGSRKAAPDILANVAMARETAIARGERQRPVVAMAGLFMLNPNKEIATLAKPAPITVTDPSTGLPVTIPGDVGDYKIPRIRSINKDTGLVEYRPDPAYKGRDNVVNFRINGIDYAIIFNEYNERAVEIAKSLKHLDVAELNTVLAAIAPITRYLAAINTQYNPIFGIVNFVRDVQFAMLALSSTPLAGKRKEILRNTKSAIAGIYADARAVRKGEHPDSPVSQLWERFQRVGGPTGYRDMFRTSEDRAKDIEHLLDPDWWQKTVAGKALTVGGLLAKPESVIYQKAGKGLLEWLSDYNQTMENAVRLGVFQAGIESGLSDLKAASLAKNITVNFNKKGQIGAQMGSMFAFFNASVQGIARMAETLFEPGKFGRLSHAGKKIIAGGVTLGAVQAFVLAMAGFDEDEPPEWLRARSIIIPVPGTDKGYVSYPMPLGFHVIPSLGRLAAETLMYGKPADKAYKMLSILTDAFSPVGGASSVTQFLAPTVVDPIVALTENKDWTGRRIYKEDFRELSPTPGFTRTKDSATPWSRGLAEALNYATGGTDYVPGKFSPTPDAIDYLIGQATGGIGREVSKTTQVVSGLLTGEDVPLYKVPGVGRFVGTSSDKAAVRNRFYDNLRDLNMVEAEIKGRKANREDVRGYIQDHPEARLVEFANVTERTVSSLNKRKRDLMKREANPEQVRLLETQIATQMSRLNERVREMQVR